jgi:hypothetical protein
MDKDESFSKGLQNLVNRYSKENNSNTPDFVLAGYIENCLTAFNVAIQQREAFYGRDPRPLQPTTALERPEQGEVRI